MKLRLVLFILAAFVMGESLLAQDDKKPLGDKPLFELRKGDLYFRADGVPSFLLGRNPVGTSPKAFDDHFRHADSAGERFMRIHFTYSPPGEKAGEIDANVLKAWDEILDAAEKRGLGVLPALGVWADWNDGSRGENWHTWDKNAFNVDRGGPAKRPDELLSDTPCRKLWFGRLEKLIKHWVPRRNIVAWEIFSEVDLITGSTEDRATEFVERAAAVIRAADTLKRPITASQAGINEWPKLLKSESLDFIEVHPYANVLPTGLLDEMIISTVRTRLKKYGKPVLLGECGLDARPPRGTLDAAPKAEVGIRHAIWASVVSGAMNGRMLWWQDGYDQFEKADLCRHYHEAAAPAATFVRGIDFTRFAPVECEVSTELKGVVLGTDAQRLAWFRDVKCVPPDWPTKRVVGQHLTLSARGDTWRVEFFDPMIGKSVKTREVSVRYGQLRIDLPPFEGFVGDPDEADNSVNLACLETNVSRLGACW